MNGQANKRVVSPTAWYARDGRFGELDVSPGVISTADQKFFDDEIMRTFPLGDVDFWKEYIAGLKSDGADLNKALEELRDGRDFLQRRNEYVLEKANNLAVHGGVVSHMKGIGKFFEMRMQRLKALPASDPRRKAEEPYLSQAVQAIQSVGARVIKTAEEFKKLGEQGEGFADDVARFFEKFMETIAKMVSAVLAGAVVGLGKGFGVSPWVIGLGVVAVVGLVVYLNARGRRKAKA